MISKLKYLVAAAALALAPVASNAATVVSGGSYDLLADSYDFNSSLAVGSAGGTYTFDFFNSSASTAAVTIFGLTVNQVTAVFNGGVQVAFGPIAANIAQGVTMGMSEDFLVAAGQTVTLVIDFGNVVNVGAAGGTADIDFVVEAAVVPVPAAGLLLLTALGGAVALRRRKAAA